MVLIAIFIISSFPQRTLCVIANFLSFVIYHFKKHKLCQGVILESINKINYLATEPTQKVGYIESQKGHFWDNSLTINWMIDWGVKITVSLLFLLTGVSNAQVSEYARAVRTTNVRSAPSTKAVILGKVRKGTTLLIVQKKPKWFKLKFPKRTAWVWAPNFTIVSGRSPVRRAQPVVTRSQPTQTKNTAFYENDTMAPKSRYYRQRRVERALPATDLVQKDKSFYIRPSLGMLVGIKGPENQLRVNLLGLKALTKRSFVGAMVSTAIGGRGYYAFSPTVVYEVPWNELKAAKILVLLGFPYGYREDTEEEFKHQLGVRSGIEIWPNFLKIKQFQIGIGGTTETWLLGGDTIESGLELYGQLSYRF